jgi:ADP-ribose pyrophosphatase YjhB (NUDIX family)
VDDVNFCQRCGARLQVEPVEGRPRPTCPACRLVVFLDPKLVVAALVEREGKVLFVRRNREPGIGRWALPGGFVERGEAVEDAVRREVEEETGLEVRVEGLVGLYSEPESTIILAAYGGEVVSGALSCQSPEVLEAAFFSVREPPPLAFPRDLRIIDDWLRWRQQGLRQAR